MNRHVQSILKAAVKSAKHCEFHSCVGIHELYGFSEVIGVNCLPPVCFRSAVRDLPPPFTLCITSILQHKGLHTTPAAVSAIVWLSSCLPARLYSFSRRMVRAIFLLTPVRTSAFQEVGHPWFPIIWSSAIFQAFRSGWTFSRSESGLAWVFLRISSRF